MSYRVKFDDYQVWEFNSADAVVAFLRGDDEMADQWEKVAALEKQVAELSAAHSQLQKRTAGLEREHGILARELLFQQRRLDALTARADEIGEVRKEQMPQPWPRSLAAHKADLKKRSAKALPPPEPVAFPCDGGCGTMITAGLQSAEGGVLCDKCAGVKGAPEI